MIYLYNKADKVSADDIPGSSSQSLPVVTQDSIYLSAKERIGMEELICLIEKKLSDGFKECTFLIPYTDGRAVSYLNENAVVLTTEYREDGVLMKVNCKTQDSRYYEKYSVQ